VEQVQASTAESCWCGGRGNTSTHSRKSREASQNAFRTLLLLPCARTLTDYLTDYLSRYEKRLNGARLAINVDDVGCREGRFSYSLYACAPQMEAQMEATLNRFSGLVREIPA
jgi:hypothetical protein